MMVRQRRFRLGQRVKLHDSSTGGGGNAYPLPPGWTHGEEVTVIGFDHGYVRVGREPLGYNPDDRRDDHAPLRMAAIRVFELNLCPSLRLILVQDQYPNGIAPSWQKAPENLRASSRMSERRLWSEFFESNSVRHAHQWRCHKFHNFAEDLYGQRDWRASRSPR